MSYSADDALALEAQSWITQSQGSIPSAIHLVENAMQKAGEEQQDTRAQALRSVLHYLQSQHNGSEGSGG